MWTSFDKRLTTKDIIYWYVPAPYCELYCGHIVLPVHTYNIMSTTQAQTTYYVILV